MLFDNHHLEPQFELIQPNLRAVLLELDWFTWRKFNKEITITSLLRDDGIHACARGGDVRSYTFTPSEQNAILVHVNGNYVYDPNRPEYNVIILHDVGQGEHFHLQRWIN
jgi:hypothetical protein